LDAAGATAESDDSPVDLIALRSVGGAYALVELGDSEAIDLFLREEDAPGLEDCLRDEPDRAGLLFIAPIALDERDVSTN
jgi:hypothetical protein